MTSNFIRAMPLFVAVLMSQSAGAQTMDALEELKACARIEDADLRGGCYEQLGQRALADERRAMAESSPAAGPEEAPIAAAPPPGGQAELEPAAATAAAAAMSGTPAPAVSAEPATAAATPAAATERLPDDIGGQQFEQNSDQTYQDRVVACDTGSDRKWIFRFESGQVWKQVSSRRVVLDPDECNFRATVNKDFFGYKMQIEGEKSKIRISRMR